MYWNFWKGFSNILIYLGMVLNTPKVALRVNDSWEYCICIYWRSPTHKSPFLTLPLSNTHIAKTAGTGKLQAKAPPNNNNGQQDTHLQDNAALENSWAPSLRRQRKCQSSLPHSLSLSRSSLAIHSPCAISPALSH